jgi:hypothetical protein
MDSGYFNFECLYALFWPPILINYLPLLHDDNRNSDMLQMQLQGQEQEEPNNYMSAIQYD